MSYADLFQPTLPARGATPLETFAALTTPYFNPRSPHGERQQRLEVRRRQNNFNPRSPHGERPETLMSCSSATWNFNPRSPHGERQSNTPATTQARHFNPRSPHGERRHVFEQVEARCLISTHAPRTGSDQECLVLRLDFVAISTHAPRTGSDRKTGRRLHTAAHFNPRSPHGERLPF